MRKIFADGTNNNIYQRIFNFQIDAHNTRLRGTVEIQGECYFILLIRDTGDRIRVQYHYQHQYQQFELEQDTDSYQPGVLPGPVIKGNWSLEVIIINYGDNAGKNVSYKIVIKSSPKRGEKYITQKLQEATVWADYNCEPPLSLNRYDWDKKFEDGQTWYKGDLHVHTVCSDGMLTPYEQDQIAEKNNLDFYFITDHNFLAVNWEQSKVLSIPGAEMTFRRGHFNALGLKKWVDFREKYIEDNINSETISEVKKSSELISLNHPFFNQWSWRYEDVDIDIFTSMEIICNPNHPDSNRANERALAAWKLLWNDGHQIWAVGGSDTHLKPGINKHNVEPTLIGDPVTYVLAENLTAFEIIQSIGEGKIYISRGPVLEPVIIIDNEKYFPGTDLSTTFANGRGKKIKYILNIDNVESPLDMYLIENGKKIEGKVVESKGKYEFVLNWKDCGYRWLTVEIRDKSGRLVVLINPVYTGEKKNRIKTWSQVLLIMDDKGDN